MLDFEPLRCKQITANELAAPLSLEDLGGLTNEMIDRMLALIAEAEDADVTFQPVDPKANDQHAARPDEVHMAWTLGHVIVHATASGEEAGAVAAELARGVPYHGRSRYETYWENVKTIAECRQRLEESRRMRLASLAMWPAAPHMDNMAEIIPGWAPMDPKGRYVLGLMHDDAHLGQIAEIMRQARISRT